MRKLKVPKRRTAEEIKRFEAVADREIAKVMLNAVERILAAGNGQRLPPKYVARFDVDEDGH